MKRYFKGGFAPNTNIEPAGIGLSKACDSTKSKTTKPMIDRQPACQRATSSPLADGRNGGKFHPMTDEFGCDTAPGAAHFDKTGAH